MATPIFRRPLMLRGRLLASLMGLILLTVLGAWLVIRGAVLRPLIGNLNAERARIALYITREVERAESLNTRLVSLAQEIDVKLELRDHPPSPRAMQRARVIERRGREILVFPGPRAPILVPIQTAMDAQPRWLAIQFPVDLNKPSRQVGLGMLLLLIAAILAARQSLRWVLRPVELASNAMIQIANGDLDHRLPENTDVTGRIGESFNRMAAQLQQLIEGQRQLMAAVSHELRTPLARMRLNIELLRDQADASTDPRLASLEGDIAEIDGLVEELLESARLERGVMALRLTSVRLDELFGEALGTIDLEERHIHLTVAPDLELVADERRLLRAINNLLSNIARYTPADTEVFLSAKRASEDTIALEVADNGPGVSSEALQRLFDPFYRAEGSRSRSTGGLGLGLMLVRQIIEAHGGAITASPRDASADAHRGLRFEIMLPRMPHTESA